ncbi:M56 family metallopeptidase [Algibacter sp. PT7-4]|uniref:M56 family metallopeptidase n=1 Tax=Algibacter ulvanivorans TaxID=3400999 RepID=UPI003AAF174C
MLLYLLKSSACLAIFMVFYKLLLEKTSAHTFKRFYLIGSILISISIPLITLTSYTDNLVTNKMVSKNLNLIIAEAPETSYLLNYLPTVIWCIYLLGVAILLVRFIKNLYKTLQKIKSNPLHRNQKFINVLLQDLVFPHTFFNYIFLNKNKFENHLIPTEVILHEQAHANQKHTIDILFIEILQIVFWFNPLLYFVKKDIKLNHEFLADSKVINSGFNTKNYQQLLLAFSSNAVDNPLANAINYSLIKKRFTVMKTKTSKTIIWFRSLILLPLLAILIYSFSSKNYVNINDNLIEVASQKKATKKQLEEYNALAKKYNTQPQDKRIIKLKDIKRLEYLYSLMSDKQKANNQPFPDCPPPPASPVVKKGEISNIPPPPPPAPKAPLDFAIHAAKKGAIFYFENNKISSDKAIELLKHNKNLNIHATSSNGKQVIKIQKAPIKL